MTWVVEPFRGHEEAVVIEAKHGRLDGARLGVLLAHDYHVEATTAMNALMLQVQNPR